jgi:hypothetical protein
MYVGGEYSYSAFTVAELGILLPFAIETDKGRHN